MKRGDFEFDKQGRKLAIRFFSDFLGQDFCVLEGKTFEELKEKYEKLFNTIKNTKEKENLYDAYSFLRNKIRYKEETPELSSSISKEIFKRYKDLIIGISEYRFETKKNNTHGEKQNRLNREILFELAFLRKYIVKSIVIIDDYFTKEEGKKLKNPRYTTLLNLVQELIMCLERTKNSLNEKRENYQNARRLKEMGESREKWRQERNEACYTILEFYKLLTEIANMAFYENYGRPRDTYYDLYGLDSSHHDREDLEFIKKGPNYYNYLSREQIFNAIECGKVKRKERLKSSKKEQ